MGGPGSGYRWSRKTTVEDCLTLDINSLVRNGTIYVDAWNNTGTLTWINTTTGERTSSVGFWVNTRDEGGPYFKLTYTIKSTGDEVEYKIPLETTRPNYGGLRWWFLCPLFRDGKYCGRRVSKLHLPPGGKHYGCRHCYDLTYQSCQDSHKDDRMYAEMAAGIPGMTASEVKEMFNRE
jgi:hypothetical protein